MSVDLDDDECDLRAATAAAHRILQQDAADPDDVRRVVGTLSVPVCGGGVDEWVVETQQQVDALRSALERRAPSV